MMPRQRTEAARELSQNLQQRLPVTSWRTRFAPAPTGFLHLGHVVNAIHVWGIARAFGGKVVLRIEDHDRQRCHREFEAALLDDLDWLGFVPDFGATSEFRSGAHSLRQSDNANRYESALQTLARKKLLYPCACSRRDIEAVALRSTSDELRYPGICEQLSIGESTTAARRLRIDAATYEFNDLRLGEQRQTPAQQCGDFLVRDRLGQYTYQFSVAVDDTEQNIDVIIRGEDLLQSTGRQLQLSRALDRKHAPRFLHHA
ncbi:MAG: glutamate--tRNA ligase family protein, partial [Gemmatimonadota bacterium]|nr:glutamate--tRNA ligase family protein [Gemmatimonadota bacterium]